MVKDATSKNLRTELKSLTNFLERVLPGSVQKLKAEFKKLRNKAKSALKDTRNRLDDSRERLVKQTHGVVTKADEYVHNNPWAGIGGGAVIGFILGAFITRR